MAFLAEMGERDKISGDAADVVDAATPIVAVIANIVASEDSGQMIRTFCARAHCQTDCIIMNFSGINNGKPPVDGRYGVKMLEMPRQLMSLLSELSRILDLCPSQLSQLNR